jgi:zinc protease
MAWSGIRAGVAAAVALGVACATQPFQGETGIRPIAFDLWDVHCPSGLRVVVERTPGSPVAGVTTVVGAGAGADPQGREGLAHLVEHLTFRAHAPDGPSVQARLASLGTAGNAETSSDDTVYYQFTAAAALWSLVTLEGERLADPLAGVDEASFSVEREVVRSELRERTETVASGARVVRGALFPPSHPYGRPSAGTHASISALTLADARRFVQARYRPADMTMVITGDVDLSRAEALVRQALPAALYGDPAHPRPVVAAGSRLPPPAAVAITPAAPLRRQQAPVRTPELWIAWAAPGGYRSDGAADMARMWAGLVESNFWWGRFSDPDIADVDFWVDPEPLATSFVCRVLLTEGAHPEQSMRAVLDALPWVGGDEMYLAERFERFKLGALRELAYSAEGIQARSEERARFAHYTGNLSFYAATVARMRAVGAGEARDFAARYLMPAQARTVLLEPMREPPAASPAARSAEDVAAAVKHAPLPPATVERLAAVKHLEGMRTLTLPNGLALAIVPRRTAPVVTASLGLLGGEVSARPGLVDAARRSIRLYTEDAPADYGIQLSFHAYRTFSALTMRAGAANLGRALDMMAFALRGYEVEWPSDKLRDVQLPLMRRHDTGPTVAFERSYRSALYAKHAYGIVETPDEMAAVPKSDIKAWLRRTFVPRNALLVIVGDVSPAEAEAAARDALGSWSADEGPVPEPPPLARPAAAGGAVPAALSPSGLRIVNRSDATQVELRIGCLLAPDGPRAHAVYDVAGEIVETALEDKLRAQAGSTYGVHVAVTGLRGGTAELELDTAIDNAQIGPALEALRGFWTDAAGAGVSADYVAAARGALATSRLLRYEHSTALANVLLSEWTLGWPLQSLDAYAADLAAVKVEEVNAALTACARSMVGAMKGDARVVRAVH